MARKALDTARGFLYTGLGSGATVEANAVKIDDTLSELDTETVVMALTANGTTTVRIAKPVARTLSGVSAKRHTAVASALGTVLLAVRDGDSTTLLSTATVDAEALTASFVAQTLTATTADLDLAAGEPITITLVSNNADATGGPVTVKLTFSATASTT